MSKAYAFNIVHRDLKRDNVMVTTDGRLKISALAQEGGQPLFRMPLTGARRARLAGACDVAVRRLVTSRRR